MSAKTYAEIIKRLDDVSCEYRASEHEPTRTSEDAARIRGVSLASGAKAIVLRTEKTGRHILCVFPAHKKLDSKAIKGVIGERVSFASDPEAITQCAPGSVPPFGSVIGLQTYVDPSFLAGSSIHFNAGELTRSIQMRFEDYLDIEKPIIVRVAKE